HGLPVPPRGGPRASRGVRSAARGRGAAALTLLRALALGLALVLLGDGIAQADTVSVADYRSRLEQAQAALARVRAAEQPSRLAALADARALLRRTTAITLPSGATLAVDDSGLAAIPDATDSALEAALARIGARIALVRHLGDPAIDAAVADARLREVLSGAAAAPAGDILEVLGRLIVRFFSGLRGPALDVTVLWPVVGVLGIAVILFILATLGRALPERVRREVFVRDAAAAERADPGTHLRAADAALMSGRPRDALHALYLYVIAALSSREAIRYDPALTDRELLVRAAAIPHADALRDLVTIYERAWFGLREPTAAEARRARELALRVAP
ncbi:MAG: DUF4129 domain-containing protein, partial [Chloroflexota bacterium]